MRQSPATPAAEGDPETFTIAGNIADLTHGKIFPGTVTVAGRHIAAVDADGSGCEMYILPGFIDAHIHIESSMLTPSAFSRLVVPNGTISTVSDPHEIANVLGMRGVHYMVDDGMSVPLKFHFGAPSCVPASPFETSGAVLGADDIESLLQRKDILYLAEMMNFPGVIAGDRDAMAKIAAARKYNKPVDGHAPGLGGDALRRYIAAGITTDHETVSYEEGLEKISLGMKILIREGSAARNFDALAPLIGLYPECCMFCSDDRHPDSLADGHIRDMVRRAIQRGIDPLTALRCASANAVTHYGLNVGLLRRGDPADFIVVDNLDDLNVLKVYIDGILVSDGGEPLFASPPATSINNFTASPKRPSDFIVRRKSGRIRVIEAMDGQILTGKLLSSPLMDRGCAQPDTQRDILKIAVVNRYLDSPPSLGFVRGFGLKRGAVASSVAHDAHNIVAVGATDHDLCEAVNLVIEHKGGLAVAASDVREVLPLPVAGIMSDRGGHDVARAFSRLEASARMLGSPLGAPFMTLSFMALSVIPSLKLTDKGLFDAELFRFTSLFVDQDC